MPVWQLWIDNVTLTGVLQSDALFLKAGYFSTSLENYTHLSLPLIFCGFFFNLVLFWYISDTNSQCYVTSVSSANISANTNVKVQVHIFFVIILSKSINFFNMSGGRKNNVHKCIYSVTNSRDGIVTILRLLRNVLFWSASLKIRWKCHLWLQNNHFDRCNCCVKKISISHSTLSFWFLITTKRL